MMTQLETVLAQVAEERARQNQLWGEQNHPNIDERIKRPLAQFAALGIPDAYTVKKRNEQLAALGKLTWADIALEEFCEAVEAATWLSGGDCEPDDLRTELIQCAAVFTQWAEAHDRKQAASDV